jgi:acyl dehydratase
MPRYLDDFTPGQNFETPRRTITETDIVNFSAFPGDWNPVHTDEVFAKESPFGERVAHGPMSIGMAFGLLSRLDLFDGSARALRNVEWSFEAPVRIGDTVRLVAEVEAVSPHPSHRDRGRLTMKAHYLNQRDEQVSRGRFTMVIKRRPETL